MKLRLSFDVIDDNGKVLPCHSHNAVSVEMKPNAELLFDETFLLLRSLDRHLLSLRVNESFRHQFPETPGLEGLGVFDNDPCKPEAVIHEVEWTNTQTSVSEQNFQNDSPNEHES
jgi:hypothetical protein